MRRATEIRRVDRSQKDALESDDAEGRRIVTKLKGVLGRTYYALRIYLHKKRWLLRSTQVVRGLWVLGPLRPLAIHYYRRLNGHQPATEKGIFSEVDVKQTVASIDKHGYAKAGQIPEHYVSEIIDYCEHTKLMKYWNPHRDCGAINRLAHDTTVVDIARRYLGAEPILWLTQLRWSFGGSTEQRQFPTSLHAEPVQYDNDAFHYDTLDFKSLTLFIYLTDVGPDSGPHVVIENTHTNKTFGELCHIILSDTMAQKKFGNQIKMILGPKGTMFFEETSCFHKAARCRTKRLMLSIDYVLQRTPPPERPAFVTA